MIHSISEEKLSARDEPPNAIVDSTCKSLYKINTQKYFEVAITTLVVQRNIAVFQ
jgi:hypothetical protein